MFESCHHSDLFGLCIEAGLRFGGRDVADRLEQAFPLTSNGFNTGGIVGAVSGFSFGVQAICRTLDGHETVVPVDMSPADMAAPDRLEKIREKRRAVCASFGTAAVPVDGVAVPLTSAPVAPSIE